jgi:hypothetical protein
MHGQFVPVSILKVLLQVKQVLAKVRQLPQRGEHIAQVGLLIS